MPATVTASRPTTASLRRVLDAVLISDTDLESFCLDYFPEVKRLFASGQNHDDRVNLLLERAPAAAVLEALGRHDPQRLEAARALLLFESAATVDAGAGKLPWNVPPASPYFTGRDPEVAALQQALADEYAGGIQAVTGLGGIGKTQLVLEYARRFRGEYRAGLFTRADTELSLLAGLAEIAQALGLAASPSAGACAGGAPDVLRAVRKWLEEHDGWLLILDNADRLELVDPLGIPFPGARGHVLLTTRAQDTTPLGIAQPLHLQKLSREESLRFLVRRIGRRGADAGPDEQEQEALRQLAEELDHLPLALEQAGAYIAARQARAADYLQSYRRRRLDLLRERPGLKSERAQVATTWALNMQEVQKLSPPAAALLELSAFLAPDAIPEELLVGGAAELSPALSGALKDAAADPLLLDDLFAPLLSYSLVERRGGDRTFGVHRLVQEVIRGGMEEAAQKPAAERAVRALCAVFPMVEFKTWEACRRLVPHVKAVAAWIDKWGFGFPEAGLLLAAAGAYLGEQAGFAQAEPLLTRGTALLEKALGAEHPLLALALTWLGTLYLYQGRYAEAEPLLARTLAIREKALPPDDPQLAVSLNNLGELRRNQGRYREAADYYGRAIAIWEKYRQADNLGMAYASNNLGLLHFELGEYAQAEPLLLRALSMWEAAVGPEHPWLVMPMNNLANVYQKQGRHKEAEPLLLRALAIKEKAQGPEHPDVALCLNNLALLYYDQQDLARAKKLFGDALRLWEGALGPKHPNLATCLANLARIARIERDVPRAEALLGRALAIGEEALGPAHARVAEVLEELADLYVTDGRFGEAEGCWKRALAGREHALGAEHPAVAAALTGLGGLYLLLGRFAEARPVFERALAIREKALGPEDAQVAVSLNNLGELHRNLKEYPQAEAHYQRARAIWQKAGAAGALGLGLVLNNLGIVHMQLEHFEQADQDLCAALAAMEGALGPAHPDVAQCLNNLAMLRASQGRFADAEPLLERALRIKEGALGKQHPDIALCCYNLGLVQARQGRRERAEALFTRALAIWERALGPGHPHTQQCRADLEALRGVTAAPGS